MKAVLSSPGDPPLIWTHAPLPNVPAEHINIHGHQHSTLKPADSPHINVSVEQLDYRPVSLVRLRRLAGALVAGEWPEGETTLERIEAVEGLGLGVVRADVPIKRFDASLTCKSSGLVYAHIW